MAKFTLRELAMSGDRFLIEKAILKIKEDIVLLIEDLLNEENRENRLKLKFQIEDLKWKIRYLEDPTSPEFDPPDYDDDDVDESCTSHRGICPCCGEHPDRD